MSTKDPLEGFRAPDPVDGADQTGATEGGEPAPQRTEAEVAADEAKVEAAQAYKSDPRNDIYARHREARAAEQRLAAQQLADQRAAEQRAAEQRAAEQAAAAQRLADQRAAERRDREQPQMLTKSGIMVGLGETTEEVIQTMQDLRAAG